MHMSSFSPLHEFQWDGFYLDLLFLLSPECTFWNYLLFKRNTEHIALCQKNCIRIQWMVSNSIYKHWVGPKFAENIWLLSSLRNKCRNYLLNWTSKEGICCLEILKSFQIPQVHKILVMRSSFMYSEQNRTSPKKIIHCKLCFVLIRKIQLCILGVIHSQHLKC